MIRGLGTKPYEERLKDMCLALRKEDMTPQSSFDSTFQIFEKLSYRGGTRSVLDHPRVQDMQQWAQVKGSQISVEYKEKLPNCYRGMTVESVTSGVGECSNTGDIQEKLG